MGFTPTPKMIEIECPRCGETFEHDSNYEDATCTGCDLDIDITM